MENNRLSILRYWFANAKRLSKEKIQTKKICAVECIKFWQKIHKNMHTIKFKKIFVSSANDEMLQSMYSITSTRYKLNRRGRSLVALRSQPDIHWKVDYSLLFGRLYCLRNRLSNWENLLLLHSFLVYTWVTYEESGQKLDLNLKILHPQAKPHELTDWLYLLRQHSKLVVTDLRHKTCCLSLNTLFLRKNWVISWIWQ